MLFGHSTVPTGIQLYGDLVVVVCNLKTQVSGARVQHQPDGFIMTLLYLDEVITSTQRANSTPQR